VALTVLRIDSGGGHLLMHWRVVSCRWYILSLHSVSASTMGQPSSAIT
jgi:hypothetical protein